MIHLLGDLILAEVDIKRAQRGLRSAKTRFQRTLNPLIGEKRIREATEQLEEAKKYEKENCKELY